MENAATGNSTLGMIIWCGVIFALMYFMMIRPNKKKMAEYKNMLAGLRVGARIIFAGGIYGTIREIKDEAVRVEIADGVVIEIPKSAVANIV
ncbi:MAG: preprotein translocase subunit YajC [Rickettsiales bacterium]|jgi:preprotein translocase subunit YajC|nr:preprotein translocase subunit YajC [Rickettsiales bacterium]